MIFTNIAQNKLKNNSWEALVKINDETVFYEFFDNQQDAQDDMDSFFAELQYELDGYWEIPR